MSHLLEFTSAALQDMKSLPPTDLPAIGRRLDALGDDPRPPGAIRLKGYPPGNYRIRIGDYRASYEVNDRMRTVTVWQVGNRKRFYNEAKRRR